MLKIRLDVTLDNDVLCGLLTVYIMQRGNPEKEFFIEYVKRQIKYHGTNERYLFNLTKNLVIPVDQNAKKQASNLLNEWFCK